MSNCQTWKYNMIKIIPFDWLFRKYFHSFKSVVYDLYQPLNRLLLHNGISSNFNLINIEALGVFAVKNFQQKVKAQRFHWNIYISLNNRKLTDNHTCISFACWILAIIYIYLEIWFRIFFICVNNSHFILFTTEFFRLRNRTFTFEMRHHECVCMIMISQTD